jgi:serine/threonine protein phosphatase PrpC
MKYATGCDTGVRKEHNEDSIAVDVVEDNHLNRTRDAGLFVLADGAGGADTGEVASYIATTVVLDELSDYLTPIAASSPGDLGIALGEQFEPDTTEGGDETPADGAESHTTRTLVFEEPTAAEIEQALEDAVEAAQQAIQAYAAESGDTLYTTIVAGLYNDGTFQYAWVGDSRAYVLNTDGERLEPLTVDHSKVQEMEERGDIDETAAMVHPEGNKISNALGIQSMRIDTGEVALYEGDTVVMTSDGLIDAYPHYRELYREYNSVEDYQKYEVETKIKNSIVTDQEIRDVLLDSLGTGELTESDLQTAVDVLLTLGNSRGGKDNMSLILFQSETFNELPEQLPARGVEAGTGTGADEPDEAQPESDEEGEADEAPDGDTEGTDQGNADEAESNEPDDVKDEKTYVLHDDEDEKEEFEGETPRQAAIKAARRLEPAEDENTAKDRSTSLKLRQAGAEKMHVYEAWAWKRDVPDDEPEQTPDEFMSVSVERVEATDSEKTDQTDTAEENIEETDSSTETDTETSSESEATESQTEAAEPQPDHEADAETDAADEEGSEYRCPSCDADLSGYDDAAFCPECGTDTTV